MSDAHATPRRRLLKNPKLLVLYALVYWGRTLFCVFAATNLALWFAGASQGLVLLIGAFALAAAFFNLGLEVGITGPPPGKRR